MRDAIQQGGAQFFAFAGGFGAGEGFDGPGALDGNRDQAAHRLQGFAGQDSAFQSQATYWLDSDAQGHETQLLFLIDNQFAASAYRLELFLAEFGMVNASAIDLFAFGQIHGRRLQSEGIAHVLQGWN